MKRSASLEDILARCGPALARMLSRADPPDSLTLGDYRQGERAVLFSIEGAGRKAAVKVFDTTSAQARAAHLREADCLRALSRSGLVPRILGTVRDPALIVTTWQTGTPLHRSAHEASLADLAWQVGTWYAEFDGSVPGQPVTTTWAEYLTSYTDQNLAARFAPHMKFLASLPVTRLSLARNDAHFSNFIRAADGTLFGIDFAETALKPEGWDILLTARVLMREYPQTAEKAIDGLLQGWGGGAGPVPRRTFLELARVFGQATQDLSFDPDNLPTQVA